MYSFAPTSVFAPRSLSPTSFHGNSVTIRSPSSAARWTAKFDMSKYAKMSADGPAGAVPPQPPSPGSSSWWTMFRDSLKERLNPFRGARDPETASARGYSQSAILAASTPYFQIQSTIDSGKFGAGGDPETEVPGSAGGTLLATADSYMADCVIRQYQMSAVTGGVYQLQCTEGTTKGQAEDSRVASLATDFQRKHRTAAQKYGDYYEWRRGAISACGGCTYEENLVSKFPRVARSMVRGFSEAQGVCVRYASGTTEAEKYFAKSVDMQMKARGVPMGVFDVSCSDGTTKGMADYKRVSALSAKFRAKQYPQSYKERARFEAAKYARDNFSHGCDYEENYFNTYGAVAAAMRPTSTRY